eukprot:TRINITY_DN5108_c0_g1_i1.p1 TRINITY_DN5108_c0_g1~~TRINITY_DN5108_c0_g1_i1.p1  ORF type:complete len:861 (-),score=151.73 TRINITY_DN5108_c0_g1_i1:366-2948(-)
MPVASADVRAMSPEETSKWCSSLALCGVRGRVLRELQDQIIKRHIDGSLFDRMLRSNAMKDLGIDELNPRLALAIRRSWTTDFGTVTFVDYGSDTGGQDTPSMHGQGRPEANQSQDNETSRFGRYNPGSRPEHTPASSVASAARSQVPWATSGDGMDWGSRQPSNAMSFGARGCGGASSTAGLSTADRLSTPATDRGKADGRNHDEDGSWRGNLGGARSNLGPGGCRGGGGCSGGSCGDEASAMPPRNSGWAAEPEQQMHAGSRPGHVGSGGHGGNSGRGAHGGGGGGGRSLGIEVEDLATPHGGSPPPSSLWGGHPEDGPPHMLSVGQNNRMGGGGRGGGGPGRHAMSQDVDQERGGAGRTRGGRWQDYEREMAADSHPRQRGGRQAVPQDFDHELDGRQRRGEGGSRAGDGACVGEGYEDGPRRGGWGGFNSRPCGDDNAVAPPWAGLNGAGRGETSMPGGFPNQHYDRGPSESGHGDSQDAEFGYPGHGRRNNRGQDKRSGSSPGERLDRGGYPASRPAEAFAPRGPAQNTFGGRDMGGDNEMDNHDPPRRMRAPPTGRQQMDWDGGFEALPPRGPPSRDHEEEDLGRHYDGNQYEAPKYEWGGASLGETLLAPKRRVGGPSVGGPSVGGPRGGSSRDRYGGGLDGGVERDVEEDQDEQTFRPASLERDDPSSFGGGRPPSSSSSARFPPGVGGGGCRGKASAVAQPAVDSWGGQSLADAFAPKKAAPAGGDHSSGNSGGGRRNSGGGGSGSQKVSSEGAKCSKTTEEIVQWVRSLPESHVPEKSRENIVAIVEDGGLRGPEFSDYVLSVPPEICAPKNAMKLKAAWNNVLKESIAKEVAMETLQNQRKQKATMLVC